MREEGAAVKGLTSAILDCLPSQLASAAFGLAVAFMVGDKSKDSSPKTSLTNGTFAMIGTLL